MGCKDPVFYPPRHLSENPGNAQSGATCIHEYNQFMGDVDLTTSRPVAAVIVRQVGTVA